MQYPGRVIRAGETDASVVKALKLQLDSALAIGEHPELRLDPDNPHFGPRTDRPSGSSRPGMWTRPGARWCRTAKSGC